MARPSARTRTRIPRSPSWRWRGARRSTHSSRCGGEMSDPIRMDRREAIQWMLSAMGSLALLDQEALAQLRPSPGGAGYGVDPNLLKTYKPGDLWPLALNAKQRRTAAVLCDVIIPAEGSTPSASALHVHDFVNEWISAPYAAQQRDRVVIVDGLAWMDAESLR